MRHFESGEGQTFSQRDQFLCGWLEKLLAIMKDLQF